MRLLRLWPDESHFDFMRFRRLSFPLSAIVSVATVVLFLTVGLNYGIDFKGGTLVELQAKSGTADVGAIRHTAADFGFGEPEVQELGNQGTVLVRLPLQPGEQGQTAVMNKAHGAFDAEYEFRRTETVGPRVSGELVQSGTLGVVLSVVAVLLYLWFRFERELALRRHRGHAARHRADHGRVHRHPHRVQHDLDRRHPHHRRLLAERDRGGVRPDARADAPLQDDSDRRAAQPVDQLDDVAHGDDLDLGLPVAAWRWCCSAARRSAGSRW